MKNYERLNGRWIAYDSRGLAFRCTRRKRNDWYGRPSHIAFTSDPRGFTASSLRELAAKIGASHSDRTAAEDSRFSTYGVQP